LVKITPESFATCLGAVSERSRVRMLPSLFIIYSHSITLIHIYKLSPGISWQCQASVFPSYWTFP
jgi:hypothetical protein